MELKDLQNAIQEKHYVIMEDPVNGTKFIDPEKRILSSYLMTGEDVVKLKTLTTETNDDGTFILVNGKTPVQIDPEYEVCVLKRMTIIPNYVKQMALKNYKIEEKRFTNGLVNIYTLHKIPMESISTKLLLGQYPYTEMHTVFQNGSYVTIMESVYNSDIIIPRVIYNEVETNAANGVFKMLNCLIQQIGSQTVSYILNGYNYMLIDGMLLQLCDIDNGYFIFRDKITGTQHIYTIDEITFAFKRGIPVSTTFVYTKLSDSNSYLYDYFNDEDKEGYDHTRLVADYKYTMDLVNADPEGPLLIIGDSGYAVFKSMDEVRLNVEKDND